MKHIVFPIASSLFLSWKIKNTRRKITMIKYLNVKDCEKVAQKLYYLLVMIYFSFKKFKALHRNLHH